MPLSLKSMTQQGGYPQIKKLLKTLKLLKWGYCLWVTQMATAGQPQHFYPCCPGGWVRPSTASNHPTVSHVFIVSSLSCRRSWYDDEKHSLVSLVLPLPEPFQLSTTALILSIFPHPGPCFCEGIPLFLSVPAEITGGFCSTGNAKLPAAWQEGEVVQKLR